MRMKVLAALVGVIVAASLSTSVAGVIGGPIVNPTTGNIYYLLNANSWPQSAAEAVSLGGHLVTVDDDTENTWVYTAFSLFGGVQRGLWIGLNDQALERSFVWANGSGSTYRNWASGEPNNAGDEDFVFIYPPNEGRGPTWNDSSGAGQPYPISGVVEVENGPCLARAAKVIAQVVNGFVVGASVTDSGCGYSNPPLVTIHGGGGQGATATAVIRNGRVTAINILSAGCCYSNPPVIIVASPPFVPTVGIRVSRVKVALHVELGRKYVLEASTDNRNWAPTGPPFVAESEALESEFEVDQLGRFFRLQAVP